MPRRRLLSIELGGAAALCAIAVAVAVGISQATSSPACASAASQSQTNGQAASQSQTNGQAASQSQTSGQATHYVLRPGNGNCSYPAANTDQMYAALSPAEYGSAAACGSYLEVTGPDRSVTVEVVDQCPECRPGHIDLSEQAFARIAQLSAGLVPVTYHTIIDPPLPAPLSLRVKEGSSPYWLALLPIGSGNPITSVRVSSASHGWHDLARASYNYWLAPSGMGAGPFTVQLTDAVGHQATVAGISLTPGVVQGTGRWMYGAGAPVAAAAPAGPTAARTTHGPAPMRTPAGPSVARTTHSPAPMRTTASPNLAVASPRASC
jgi:expansin (peptidoglycan-binding protein)